MRKMNLIKRIGLGTAVISAGLLAFNLISAKREIKPVFWYDINRDGIEDAIIEDSRRKLGVDISIRNPKAFFSSMIYAAQNRDKISYVFPQNVQAGFVDGKTIIREGTNYFSNGKFNPLDVKWINYDNRRKHSRMLWIGDHDGDGNFDITLDDFEVASTHNTKYSSTNTLDKK